MLMNRTEWTENGTLQGRDPRSMGGGCAAALDLHLQIVQRDFSDFFRFFRFFYDNVGNILSSMYLKR